eukprot:CAMPEP_0183722008 /NCGR_PEP_ID=MMETSP0737-20130205/14088_1 /TAXON_ID=385413 /ORGANISM="Thalassiosira miniscula, Strain CCMP1093" /LENGTH=365 /DNA_ID=CAMNT_0025952093 /DNA_START=187 /DNA_END=1284 /DNA_ORIENTATION=+
MMARTPSSSQPFQATASADADVLGQTSTPSMLMDDILRGNSTAASTAVEMLMEVRGTETMEDYLGEMLPPQRSDLPLWARMPLLARFSRRARQLRLSKLLELSTPSTDGDQEEKEEDGVSTKRRARRSLFVLLRTMANNPDYTGVSSMLAMAKRDAKDNVSSEEMLKRTPDLETPNYEVLKSKKGGFEVRRYDKFSVCSVTMNELKNSSGSSDKESASKLSNPQLSGATSFGALAGYLFGKNEEQTAMKMTTPVFSEGEGSSRTMSFVLPSDYWQDEGAAPKPLSDSVVRVSSVDGCDRAVLAFPGFGRKTDVETRSSRLREILESDKDWRAVDDATVLLAQYNDPFTPPWKRRNEVSLSVEPRQ